MGRYNNGSFTVGDWLVEPDLSRISWYSQTTALRPQVMELLVYLARHGGRVVSAEELLDDLWAGKVVTGSTVYNCVAELRHALANGSNANAYIETVPKRGYRLLAEVVGIDTLPPNDPTTVDRNSLGRKRSLVVGAAAVLTAVFLGIYVTGMQTTDQTVSGSSVSLRLPLQLPDIADGSIISTWNAVALSPDGRQIAYIGFDGADQHLYLKRAGVGVARKMPNTEGARTPFFSPDGAWIAYFAKGKLKRVSAVGGSPVIIGNVPGVAIGASWGDDDNIIFNIGYRSFLQRIPSAGGSIEAITELADGEATHRHAHVLPNANAVLFQVGSPGSLLQSDPAQIWVLDRQSDKKHFLIEGASPSYGNGKLIFEKQEKAGLSVWAVDFDPIGLQVSGEAAPLVTGPIQTWDASLSGALIYSQPRRKIEYRLRIIDEAGSKELMRARELISHPRFSTNEESLAVSIRANTATNIWVFDLLRDRQPSQITTEQGIYPIWSPDDRSLSYSKWTKGVFRQELGSSAAPEPWVPFDGLALPLQWTADGLLYAQANPRTHGDIYYLPEEGQRISIDADEIVSLYAEISPNGQWVAYSRMNADHPQVFVKEFPDGERVWQVSRNDGDNPKWSDGGSKLFYMSYNKVMSRTFSDDAPVSFGPPEIEFELSASEDITLDPFDVSSDGKRLAIVDTIYADPPAHIYVSDWQ